MDQLDKTDFSPDQRGIETAIASVYEIEDRATRALQLSRAEAESHGVPRGLALLVEVAEKVLSDASELAGNIPGDLMGEWVDGVSVAVGEITGNHPINLNLDGFDTLADNLEESIVSWDLP